MEHGQRVASCDTSLVVTGVVDCGRRRRNVYDKRPQRYAKDNRKAHLTERSDKSVAYVTNNKRLYWTFCTIEANYWQTRSIARPLCDSRATCICTRRVCWYASCWRTCTFFYSESFVAITSPFTCWRTNVVTKLKEINVVTNTEVESSDVACSRMPES